MKAIESSDDEKRRRKKRFGPPPNAANRNNAPSSSAPCKTTPDFSLARRYERDHEFERQAMQCSEVELLIRNAAHSCTLRRKLKVSFDSDKNPIFCNGQVLVKPNVPYACMPSRTRTFPFYTQPECEPTILHHDQGILNGDMRLRAKFLFIRLSYINLLANSVIPPLEENCSWTKADKDCGAYLGRHWKIAGNWDAVTAPQGRAWAYLPTVERNNPEFFSTYIDVFNAEEVNSYTLQIFNLLLGKYAVLPIAHYQGGKCHQPLKLFIPPKPPYTLLNAHLLREYPDATVCLVNDVIFALANPTSHERIFLANVGGDAWVDQLDIEPLRGRRVVCLAFKMINDDETRESYQSTLKLASRLDAIGIAPEFSLLNFGRSLLLPTPKPSNLPVLISEMKVEAPPIGQSEFIKMAEAAGACIPPPLRLDRYGAVDIEVERRAAPLIKNLVYSGETTVIVEHENVEPNLISRVIVALSNNVEGFAISHWKNVAVGKVGCIVFIDVEHKKRYTRKLLELGDLANGKPILYDTRLFAQPEDECLKELKQVVHKNSPRVVVFDAETLWTEGSGRIAVLRKFVRHCLEKNIALVVILRDGKLMQHLSTPNRKIDIWKDHRGEFAYIVESHEHSVEHFGMAYEGQVDNGNIENPFSGSTTQAREFSVLVSRTVDQYTLNEVDGRMHVSTGPGVARKVDKSV